MSDRITSPGNHTYLSCFSCRGSGIQTRYLGVVGSRRRNTEEDLILLENWITNYLSQHQDEQVILVSGGCPKGADHFAEVIAEKLGLDMLIHYPFWEKYGKSAGFRRNTYIVDDSDELVALPSPDRKGGTEDTIAKAEKQRKKVTLL